MHGIGFSLKKKKKTKKKNSRGTYFGWPIYAEGEVSRHVLSSSSSSSSLLLVGFFLFFFILLLVRRTKSWENTSKDARGRERKGESRMLYGADFTLHVKRAAFHDARLKTCTGIKAFVNFMSKLTLQCFNISSISFIASFIFWKKKYSFSFLSILITTVFTLKSFISLITSLHQMTV